MIQYAADCVKKWFLRGCLLLAIWLALGPLIQLVRIVWLVRLIACVWLAVAIAAIVCLIIVAVQTVTCIIACFTKLGWHEKVLTKKQLDRSVFNAKVKTPLTQDTKVKYWRGFLMRRFVEEVIK